ncbi:MAG: hypothetical protein FJ385_01665 [Verrucomicrobia bacterium]|nr:hypothetical protein [Verrucomicrobiota bacterium]
MEAHVLRDRRVKGRALAPRFTGIHPLLDRGGCDLADPVVHGKSHAGQHLPNHPVFIGGIHRVGPGNHQHQPDLHAECAKLADEFRHVIGISTGKRGNLHALDRQRRDPAKCGQACDDPQLAGLVAWQSAMRVGHQAVGESEMGRHNAEPHGRTWWGSCVHGVK